MCQEEVSPKKFRMCFSSVVVLNSKFDLVIVSLWDNDLINLEVIKSLLQLAPELILRCRLRDALCSTRFIWQLCGDGGGVGTEFTPLRFLIILLGFLLEALSPKLLITS